MKIVVCVKQVPDASTSREINHETKRLDRTGGAVLNPFDANAIEEALRIKERLGDGEVAVITLGPVRAVDALRKALAIGGDRAVHVLDQAAEGSDLVATSYILARALERQTSDLVLFGQQASDSDGAVLWAAVAERLKRPLISQVSELTVDGLTVRGRRQTEFGYDIIDAPLPAVVAVSDAINEPRYPSFKGIMAAKKKPQESISLSELDVEAERAGEAGSRTTVLSVSNSPLRSPSEKIGDDGTAAEKIVAFLAQRNLL